MNSLKHLVVAFDGTDDSKEALELGINMSKKMGSNLSLIYIHKENLFTEEVDHPTPLLSPVHSYPAGGMGNIPVVPAPQENISNKETLMNPEKSKQIMALENEAKQILDHHHVQADVAVSYGEPSEGIVTYAKENNGDLIVVGSRDISGLKKIIFGSVSEKVSQRASIPVLIAK
jgi:nucleotide-binding universal stress UspA family protein